MSLVSARRYIMEASLYFPLSKYLFPLSTYFLETKRGSRLQAATTVRQSAAPSKRTRKIHIVCVYSTIPILHSLGALSRSFLGSSVLQFFGSQSRGIGLNGWPVARTE